jgi:hypothetical protein
VLQTIPEFCTYRLEFERFHFYEIMKGMVLGREIQSKLAKVSHIKIHA